MKDILFKSFIVFFIVFLLLMSLFVILSLVWSFDAQEYVTDNIVECNDADGDLIVDLICYDKVTCLNKLKFLNEEGCEEFVG